MAERRVSGEHICRRPVLKLKLMSKPNRKENHASQHQRVIATQGALCGGWLFGRTNISSLTASISERLLSSQVNRQEK